MSFCSMELVFRAQVYASVLFSGSDTASDIQGFLFSSANCRRILQSCVSCPMYELLPFQGRQFCYWLQKVDGLNSTCRLYPRNDEGPSQSLESCQCQYLILLLQFPPWLHIATLKSALFGKKSNLICLLNVNAVVKNLLLSN